MEFDDYVEPEIAVTAAVAAAVFSPQIRGLLRRGLVYALAGAMIAGDTVASFARSVGEGVQQAGASAARAAQGEHPQQQTQQAEHTGNQAPPGGGSY